MLQKTVLPAIIVILSISILSAFTEPDTTLDWRTGQMISRSVATIDRNNEGIPIDRYTGRSVSVNRSRVIAYTTARSQALTSLVRGITSLKVDADYKVSDILEQHPSIQRKFSTLLMDYAHIHQFPTGYDSSGCEITLPLGSLLEILPVEYSATPFPVPEKVPEGSPYSGLIIDTRGLEVTPMLLPVIHNNDGREIYSYRHVDIRFALDRGLVSYATDEDEARSLGRAGERPYYTVALRSLGGSPVISDRDVERLFSSNATISHLKKCRVIFIIDTDQFRK